VGLGVTVGAGVREGGLVGVSDGRGVAVALGTVVGVGSAGVAVAVWLGAVVGVDSVGVALGDCVGWAGVALGERVASSDGVGAWVSVAVAETVVLMVLAATGVAFWPALVVQPANANAKTNSNMDLPFNLPSWTCVR
jgi:hypothetical protein